MTNVTSIDADYVMMRSGYGHWSDDMSTRNRCKYLYRRLQIAENTIDALYKNFDEKIRKLEKLVNYALFDDAYDLQYCARCGAKLQDGVCRSCGARYALEEDESGKEP